jgi:hypothetical protein
MSDTASSWSVSWKDPGGGPEHRTFYGSREMAIDAASEYNRYQTAERIEGPNGEVIERGTIEQLCSGRPRRP